VIRDKQFARAQLGWGGGVSRRFRGELGASLNPPLSVSMALSDPHARHYHEQTCLIDYALSA
jgi:hypothetical protein